jgi:hypothetical protein
MTLMFRMLIDTCVSLDPAKDPKQVPILGGVEELFRLGMVSLIVPSVGRDEFRRNREHIAKESAESFSTHCRLVKEAVGEIGDDGKKMRVILAHLDDADHKLPIIGGEAVGPHMRPGPAAGNAGPTHADCARNHWVPTDR